jgi:transcriptional regulator with XRE-family HTH domain
MRVTKPLPTFKPAIVDVVTLEQLRKLRGSTARDLAATIGVDPSTVSRYETSVDPKLSTIESYLSALGGRLQLLAIFPRADGTLEKHLIRTADDRRGEVPPEVPGRRHRPPLTSRPAREMRVDRLEEARRLQEPLALEKVMTHPLIVVESTQQPNKPRAKS